MEEDQDGILRMSKGQVQVRKGILGDRKQCTCCEMHSSHFEDGKSNRDTERPKKGKQHIAGEREIQNHYRINAPTT